MLGRTIIVFFKNLTKDNKELESQREFFRMIEQWKLFSHPQPCWQESQELSADEPAENSTLPTVSEDWSGLVCVVGNKISTK